MPRAMDEYYKFVNRIVDIRLTAKRELVEVYDAANGGVRILVREINKDGEVKKLLMDRDYDPKITRELRLYLSGGIDYSVVPDQSYFFLWSQAKTNIFKCNRFVRKCIGYIL